MNKIKSFLSIFTFAILLQGCLNYIQVTKLEKDHSGEMQIHYWAKIPALQDSLLILRLGIFDEDSIRSNFSSEFTQIQNIDIFNNSEDTTLHAKIDFRFSAIDSMNNMDAFRGYNFKLEKIGDNTTLFKQEIPPFSSGFGITESKANIRYMYNFPGRIIDHNADTVENGTLIWGFDSDEIGMGKTISATYSFGEGDSRAKWVYLAILLLALLFALIYFVKRAGNKNEGS